jgi:hypothetical protein
MDSFLRSSAPALARNARRRRGMGGPRWLIFGRADYLSPHNFRRRRPAGLPLRMKGPGRNNLQKNSAAPRQRPAAWAVHAGGGAVAATRCRSVLYIDTI